MILMFLMGLSACTSIRYRDVHGEWERISFGTNLQLQRVVVRIGADGAREIEADGIVSDQTKALEAVAEGAARGAASAVRP